MDPTVTLAQFVVKHPHVLLLIPAWYFESMIAASLPTAEEIWPAMSGGKYFAYRTIFNLMHAVAGSLPRVLESMRMKVGPAAPPAPIEVVWPDSKKDTGGGAQPGGKP